MVFSTNELPVLKKESQEYYTRWIIFPFSKSFYGHEDASVEEKITTPEEMSGILNWALVGLERLLKNGEFSYTEDAARFYRRMAEPVAAFLEDWCTPDYRGFVTKENLMNAFNLYAEENGFPPAPSKKKFGTYIKDQLIIPVEEGRRTTKKDGVAEAWNGIVLREEIQQYIDSLEHEDEDEYQENY